MEWLDVLKSVIYGIVEGVTEWLPVSSTGHLILLKRLLPFTSGASAEQSAAFFSFYLVVIQLGAILAVVVTFWKKLWPFPQLRHAIPDPEKDAMIPFSAGGSSFAADRRILRLWLMILIACVPAALVGVLFDDKIEALFYNAWTVAVMLILVGAAFLVVERLIAARGKRPGIRSTEQIGWRTALIIGLFQLIAAVFPGTSRSGATILGGLLIGMARPVAAAFTFYLAVPVMAGASLLKLITRSGAFSAVQWLAVFVGMAVAYLVSTLVIRFLMNYVRRHDFGAFAVYRIMLGVIVVIAAVTKFI